MEFLKKLFETDFMPHGHCYLWKPEIVYTNAISDGIIAIAYMSIPLSLIYITRSRQDFRYYWLTVLFAVFILGCGSTHVMDVINIWQPMYRLDSSLRVITALASIGTAFMLAKLTPKIVLIPDVNVFKKMNQELTETNLNLEKSYKEIAAREEELRLLNLELAGKIETRTKELRESENRFRTMANHIPNLAWIANGDGYITWYNKRWYDYTGTNPEQMEGWGWQSVHDPQALPSVIQRWSESIKTGEPFEMVMPLKRADGTFRPFLTRVMPVKGEDGNTIQWFGTNTDVTEQVENEKILENKNRELMKINADLDNFVYTASHDLKAPVSNIEGLLQSLPDIVNNEIKSVDEFQQVMGMINLSIQKFKNTIDDLAEISKVQKNIDEDIEIINVGSVVDDVIVLLKENIKEAKANIKIDTSACPTIHFSKRNFSSIIYNLLSNAIKYRSPERPLTMEVSAKTMDEYAILSFSDNGLGFPESKADRIFGMFKRLHDHVEGTGVGLYIVKRIVDNAGGRIEVESEVGKGSTFRIYLKK